MKKTLFLALGSFFLQTAACFAQGASGPPAVLPPAGPVIVDQEPSLPLSTWMGSSCPQPRVWGGSEVLMWWTKNAPVNTPLLTATQANPLTDPTAGTTSSPNTAVLLGGQSYDLGGPRFGGRFTLGAWLDSESLIGVEANYLFIAPRSISRGVASDGSTTIGLPYFNVNTTQESFQPLATPGIGGFPATSGGAFLNVSNRLQGGELNGVGRLIRNDSWSLDGLAGFRYVNFEENLDYGTDSFFPGASVPLLRNRVFNTPSITRATLDSFHAENNFYGGQLGLRGQYQMGAFFVEGTGKIALGYMNETMNIAGSSFSGIPGGPPAFNFVSNQGGFYAQPTNIGNHTRNVFCAVPEAELKLGYNVTRNIQIFAAYNFLYLSSVERPGTAIDHSINPSIVPVLAGSTPMPTGPPAPNFSFSRSDFWAQGINFGVQFKF